MADVEPLTLDELIALVRTHWPIRYTRGRLTHIHRNDLTLANGARVHLRVLVQTVADPPTPPTSTR